jgi:hypothetical protein
MSTSVPFASKARALAPSPVTTSSASPTGMRSSGGATTCAAWWMSCTEPFSATTVLGAWSDADAEGRRWARSATHPVVRAKAAAADNMVSRAIRR